MEKYNVKNKESGRELNILNVGPMPPRTGGSCFVNNETLTSLSKNGHYVRCVTQASDSQVKDANYDSAWRGSGVEVYPVVADFVQSSQRLPEREVERRRRDIVDQMYQLIDDSRPDVVMTGHESYAYYANEAASKRGLPVVQVLHGTPTHIIGRGEYPKDLTERFINSMNCATLVVGVSNALANVVRRYGINHATYIHNGTDTQHFQPRKEPDKNFLRSIGANIEDKVVLHASTLRDIKRPLDIVESAKYALDKDPNLYYVIVGDGKLKGDMEERVVELGIEDRFKFTGRVDYGDIPDYFQHAQVFLLPSENEGFGRVLREAQACKSVPIASDLEATREVIDNGKTGYLFKKGHVKNLAKKTLELTKNVKKRMLMANRGHDVATSNNLVSMVRRYESVLKNPQGLLANR
jgi:glycosyltransferase involved in cell wall biosynthesis